MRICVWICHPTVLWALYTIWITCHRGDYTTPHITKWPPTAPQKWSDVTLVFGLKSLNHAPHQWCSDPRMMIHGWIYYPTVLWLLYDACTTSDSGESPHIPLNNLWLNPGHAQLIPWFLDSRAWTVHLTSGEVVQGWGYMYGYAIPLFNGYYMKHEPCLTWVDHPHATEWPQTTGWTYSDVTLVFGPISLNHGPQ